MDAATHLLVSGFYGLLQPSNTNYTYHVQGEMTTSILFLWLSQGISAETGQNSTIDEGLQGQNVRFSCLYMLPKS